MTKLKKLVQLYCEFFDRETTNSTIVVWVIWALIFGVGIVCQPDFWTSLKSNVIEFNSYNSLSKENVVFVWWKQYKVIFQEIK